MELTYNEELSPISFIAGHYQELEFTVTDTITKEPVDLVTFNSIKWVLFRFGDPENPLLTLDGHVVADDASKVDVFIDSEYTKDLDGFYVHQLILTDSNDKEFRPAQGGISIVPRGWEENSLIIQS